MPYIKPELRDELVAREARPRTPGELNYLITHICLEYLKAYVPNYDSLNEVMGVLTCVQQEFYRRKVVPYEMDKIIDNGDVY